MAEMKKYLDTTALSTLVDKIKEADAKVLSDSKAYADSLAPNYDAAGTAATEAGKVQSNLNTYIESNNAAVALKADKTALEAEVTRAKAAEEANTALINAIKDGTELDSFKDVEEKLAGYQVSGDYAVNGHKHVMADITDLAAALDLKADKSALEAEVERAEGIEAGLQSAIDAINNEESGILAQAKAYTDTQYEGAMTKIEKDFEAVVESHDADIEAINNKIGTVAENTTVVAMIEAVDAIADKNAEDIVTINEAIKDIQENAYDDTELRGLISDNADAIALLTNGVDAEVVDGVNDLIAYVAEHGTEVTGIKEDIADNAKAIADHIATNHDFAAADATLKSELEGKIALKADASVVEAMDTAYKAADTEIKGRLDVLEAIDHDAYVAADTALENKLNAEIAKKADATALEAAVEALEGADSDLDERLQLVEAQLGDGETPVVDLIATAKQEAIDAAKTDASNKDAVVLAEAQKGIDAVQASLDAHIVEATAVAGRVTTAEGEIDTLQSEMDAVEALAAANKAAHEANAGAIALKAAQADLEAAVARIAANETAIAANTSAINSFTAITSDEVNALFA